MYEQEGEADRQGNLEFIALRLHMTKATSWSLFVSWKCYSRFAAYGDTLLRHIHSQNKFDFEICLSSPPKVSKGIWLSGKKDDVSASWKSSKIPQLPPPPFFFFPSGKDEAKTASSPRLFWKTTTRRSRTPSTRAGTWLSHARAVRGRPPRPSSTRGRPTSWSVCPGGTCWVRGDRLMSFPSLSPCTL